MSTDNEFAIDVSYFAISEPLQPYFAGLYSYTITCPPGKLVSDQLHPEWGAMYFVAEGSPSIARFGPGPLEPQWPFVVTGPTSKALRFGLPQSLVWGVGMLPAGYARFVPIPVSTITDTTLNGSTHPGFVSFTPLLDIVSEEGVDGETMARRIERFLLAQPGQTAPHIDQVIACQNALRDPAVTSVNELSERVGLGRRSLERLCSRYFGFSPKLLLRRQRFLRSLAQFTVAGAANWSRALDGQYYDQAHFVHDFRAFMGMSPSEYAEMPHPVLKPAMEWRMINHGALPPTGFETTLRYGKVRRGGAL